MKKKMRRTVAKLEWMAAACALATLAACAAPQPRADTIEVSSVYVVGGVAGAPAALYATIANPTNSPDTLVALTTPIADRADLHTQMQHGEGLGAMVMMAPVAAIPIPSGDTVRLSPGGRHGMLSGLHRPIVPGDTVDVELVFRTAGAVAARAAVVRYGDLERLLDTAR